MRTTGDGDIPARIGPVAGAGKLAGTASIQPGCINYGQAVYLILNGPVNPGDPVVLAADDPAARTPEGGYVNAAAMAVADM